MKTYTISQHLVLSVLVALFCFATSPRSSFEPQQAGPYKQWIVEVLGSVPRPGLYLFNNAPTPGKALNMAGLSQSRFGSIQGRESSTLPSGTTVHVPSYPSRRLILKSTAIHKSFIAGLPMDINKASPAELSLVPGISNTLAHRIVLFRKQHGHFVTWNDLDQVKGLGPATIKRAKNYIQLPAPRPFHRQ